MYCLKNTNHHNQNQKDDTSGNKTIQIFQRYMAKILIQFVYLLRLFFQNSFFIRDCISPGHSLCFFL